MNQRNSKRRTFQRTLACAFAATMAVVVLLAAGVMALAVSTGAVDAYNPGSAGHPTSGDLSDLKGRGKDVTLAFQRNANIYCNGEEWAATFTFNLDYTVSGSPLPAGATLVVYLSPNNGAINYDGGGDPAAYIAAVESNEIAISMAGRSGSGTLSFTLTVTTAFEATHGGVLGVVANDIDGSSWSTKDRSLNCFEAATPVSTPTPTATATAMATPTATATATPAATPTPTVVPTATPTDVPTPAPTEAPTATPTDAPTATPTDVPTATPTDAPTAMPTDVPTATPTDAPTGTPTDAPTATPTDAPTETPTDAPTETPTDAPTETPTDVSTETPTEAPTPTPTDTPTATATATATPMGIPTGTPQATETPAPETVQTPTATATPGGTPAVTPATGSDSTPSPTATPVSLAFVAAPDRESSTAALPVAFPPTGGNPEAGARDDGVAVLLGMLLGGLIVTAGVRILCGNERKLDD